MNFMCHVFSGLKPLEIGASGGAIYLPYLVLHHTAWSTQKGMSTLYGLGA